MKLPLLLPLLFAALIAALMPVTAQTTTDDATANTDETAPAGSTVITSDELHSDQANHISVFTGKVIVVGTNFRMTCQEMTVNFTKDNKVDTIVATGDVVINQPDRITNCGRAVYSHDDDKFDLTEQPIILDHKNKISGPEIIIYRTTQQMQVKGGRSHVILGPEALSTPSTATSTPTPSTDNK